MTPATPPASSVICSSVIDLACSTREGTVDRLLTPINVGFSEVRRTREAMWSLRMFFLRSSLSYSEYMSLTRPGSAYKPRKTSMQRTRFQGEFPSGSRRCVKRPRAISHSAGRSDIWRLRSTKRMRLTRTVCEKLCRSDRYLTIRGMSRTRKICVSSEWTTNNLPLLTRMLSISSRVNDEERDLIRRKYKGSPSMSRQRSSRTL